MCMSNAQRDKASKVPAMAELFKAAKRDRGDEEGLCQKPTAATTKPAPTAAAAADPAKAAPPRCSRSARRRASTGSDMWCRCSGKGKLIGSANSCKGKSPTCEWDDAMKQCLPPKAVKQTEFKGGELVVAPPVAPAKNAVEETVTVAKEPVAQPVLDGSGGRRSPYKPVAKEPVVQPVLDGSGGRRPPSAASEDAAEAWREMVAKEPVAQPVLDGSGGRRPPYKPVVKEPVVQPAVVLGGKKCCMRSNGNAHAQKKCRRTQTEVEISKCSTTTGEWADLLMHVWRGTRHKRPPGGVST